MQFIKGKLGQFKEYSKNIFTRNKVTNSPKDLLQYLLTHSIPDQFAVYQQLAQISRTSERNSEIADIIVTKLQHFNYEAAVMLKTDKLLSVIVYLLKNGSSSFAFDLKNNLGMLKSLQFLDSKRFEGSLKKNAKELSHRIEIIKHRAKYIEKLVMDENLLDQERQKAANRRDQTDFRLQAQDIGQTSTGLKMATMTSIQETQKAPGLEKGESTFQRLNFNANNNFKVEY